MLCRTEVKWFHRDFQVFPHSFHKETFMVLNVDEASAGMLEAFSAGLVSSEVFFLFAPHIRSRLNLEIFLREFLCRASLQITWLSSGDIWLSTQPLILSEDSCRVRLTPNSTSLVHIISVTSAFFIGIFHS